MSITTPLPITTAKWCIDNAIHYYHELQEKDPATWSRLNDKLKLHQAIDELRQKSHKLYLPAPNDESVIPQDDTYLSLKEIDLTRYKNQTHVGSIFKDFNLHQVNQMQVSKQASVVMLMYLLEHRFDAKVKQANYDYYEPRTLHDSSLSLSTHAVLANDLGHQDLAYQLFGRAARIDLGPSMTSSNHGIHAAAIGGIWQIVVCGFGGVRMVGGELRISPQLPDAMSKLTYPIIWRGNRLEVAVEKEQWSISQQRLRTSALPSKREDIDHFARPNEPTWEASEKSSVKAASGPWLSGFIVPVGLRVHGRQFTV